MTVSSVYKILEAFQKNKKNLEKTQMAFWNIEKWHFQSTTSQAPKTPYPKWDKKPHQVSGTRKHWKSSE